MRCQPIRQILQTKVVFTNNQQIPPIKQPEIETKDLKDVFIKNPNPDNKNGGFI